MFRRTLHISLGIALVATSLVPLSSTLAAGTKSTALSSGSLQHSEPVGLPDFDIRDQLEAGSDKAAPVDGAVVERRFEAVETFRAGLADSKKVGLHYEIARLGAARAFFNFDGPLSESRHGSADALARAFLLEQKEIIGLTAREVAGLAIEMNHEFEGTTFLEYTQTVRGLRIHGSVVKVVVTAKGEVTHVSTDRVVPGARLRSTVRMPEQDAIARAFEHAGASGVTAGDALESRKAPGDVARFVNPLGENHEPITSALRAFEVGGQVRLAYEVTTDVRSSEWYDIVLDAATGELLMRRNLYSCAQGLVYTQSPAPMGSAVSQSTQQFAPIFGVNAADIWIGASTTVTTGNNVDAYLDTDANNAPDNINVSGIVGGRASSATQDFSWTYTQGVDPRTQRAPVVTNLFYYNNYMHDWMYSLGFTESARNFQTNNYGRGGAGNDAVKAEAQDGSGTNNANFATPADGSSGRMQQYLFTLGAGNADDRDSSLDADVVFHEYGHGVSNRLVNNGSGLSNHQGRSMGEGWSDYWACTAFNNGVMGDYVTNNTVAGIRRAGYNVPAATVHDSFADLGGSSVHNDGEIWCATLWDLRTQLGATVTDRLVLEGMKYTASSPSMPHARDGILQADQNLNGGANKCAIWTVFARHGMGFSAGYANGSTEQPATNLPAECGGTPCSSGNTAIGDNVATGGALATSDCTTTAGNGSAGAYYDLFTFSGTSGASVTITMNSTAFDCYLRLKNPSGTVVASDDDGNGGTNSRIVYTLAATGTFTIEATSYGPGSTGAYTVTRTGGGSGGGGTTVLSEGAESGAAGWTVSTNASGNNWVISANGRRTGANGFRSNNATATYPNNLDQSLISPAFSLAGKSSASLNYYYKQQTETSYDYLRVEVSTNGGSSWTSLSAVSTTSSGFTTTAGAGMVARTISLNSYAGQANVKLRFRLTTDVSVVYWGAAIDDIAVTAN